MDTNRLQELATETYELLLRYERDFAGEIDTYTDFRRLLVEFMLATAQVADLSQV